MAQRSFTLLVIPDTPRVKALQVNMSFGMFFLIVSVMLGFVGGSAYLLYDFQQANPTANIIARNLERRQQIQLLNTELSLLERRMIRLLSHASPQEISLSPLNKDLLDYQNRIERLRQQAELFTPILLRKVEMINESIAREQAVPSSWPLRGYITSNFGYRSAPFSGKWTMHTGIDIAAERGSKIFAPANAIVITSEYRSGYGNFVELDHGYGIRTRYGHASALLVKVGQNIKRGDVIALVGSTGNSTGPHLHYEIRIDGVAVDPRNHITEDM